MSTEIDELKQARYRSDKTISGHNAFLRPPTGETNSVDTRGFYFVLKEPHPYDFASHASSKIAGILSLWGNIRAMEVRLYSNSSRPGVGLKPRRESQRPLLPQHA